MNSLSAYLLVSHGSRDIRPQIALEGLADLVQKRLNQLNKGSGSFLSSRKLSKYPSLRQVADPREKAATLIKNPSSYWVKTATLELGTCPLHQRIQQITAQLQRQRGNHLKIVPLFLLKGVHVLEDIPTEIALAKKSSCNGCTLELCPYLGSYPQIRQLLAAQFANLSTPGRILLSHGSRRLGANQLIEEIGSQLGAKVAYWSMAPSLAEQVKNYCLAGCKEIGILPYFLFKGSITDAIASEVQQLQQTYPNLKLQLGEPLGATAELANLIVEAII